jgi:hypothetical protein
MREVFYTSEVVFLFYRMYIDIASSDGVVEMVWCGPKGFGKLGMSFTFCLFANYRLFRVSENFVGEGFLSRNTGCSWQIAQHRGSI